MTVITKEELESEVERLKGNNKALQESNRLHFDNLQRSKGEIAGLNKLLAKERKRRRELEQEVARLTRS